MTAPALLLLRAQGERKLAAVARRWLLYQTGREIGAWARLLRRMGVGTTAEEPEQAWPWVPDTAAWVAPTALALAALGFAEERAGEPEAQRAAAERSAAGRRFLLAHAARAGGWNHDSIRVFGVEGEAYPETTGLALQLYRQHYGVIPLEVANTNAPLDVAAAWSFDRKAITDFVTLVRSGKPLTPPPEYTRMRN